MTIWKVAGTATLALLLAGCESAPVKQLGEDFQNLIKGGQNLFNKGDGKAEQTLAAGVRQYEDANYAEAGRLLQSSLDQGLSSEADQIRAHKYLAFIHCVSGRQTQCRNEFRAVLDINPAFELAPSEAGHPMWGPVFRSAKGQR